MPEHKLLVGFGVSETALTWSVLEHNDTNENQPDCHVCGIVAEL